MAKVKRSGFSPVIPLLFVAFILTSFIALRDNNPTAKVLGEQVENPEPLREIRDVRLDQVKTRLENVVNTNKNNRGVEVANENNRVRVRVQTENEDGTRTLHNTLELKPEESDLNLRVREATAPGEAGGVERRLRVSPDGANGLKIEDNNHEVRTKFPITVNESDNTITITTPRGDVKVRELPSTAIQNLIKREVFSDVTNTTITESADKNTGAVLNVEGENRVKLFGVMPIRARVSAEVDPETGEVKRVSAPWFLRSFGFLFTK